MLKRVQSAFVPPCGDVANFTFLDYIGATDMSAFPILENKLDELSERWAPELSDSGKRTLTGYLPLISLVLGFANLYAAYLVWHWAHVATRLLTYTNNLSASYGGPRVSSNHLTFGIWLGLVVLVIEVALYLVAYPALRTRKKVGWDLLFYALLLNVLYGAIIMFTAYGDVGNLIGNVIGSGVGLYALLQIRDAFGAKTPPIDKRPAKKSVPKKA
jgi:hypothetical protein